MNPPVVSALYTVTWGTWRRIEGHKTYRHIEGALNRVDFGEALKTFMAKKWEAEWVRLDSDDNVPAPSMFPGPSEAPKAEEKAPSDHAAGSSSRSSRRALPSYARNHH